MNRRLEFDPEEVPYIRWCVRHFRQVDDRCLAEECGPWIEGAFVVIDTITTPERGEAAPFQAGDGLG